MPIAVKIWLVYMLCCVLAIILSLIKAINAKNITEDHWYWEVGKYGISGFLAGICVGAICFVFVVITQA